MSVKAMSVKNNHNTSIFKENNLTFTLFLENEQIPEDSEISDVVELNYLRVKASETMHLALNMIDTK